MIQYRTATADDVPELHRIRISVRENVLSDPGLITPEEYNEFLTKRGQGWLAEESGQILGFAIVDLKGNNIWALFVHPDAEGRGIGRRLHDIMMDWYFEQTDNAVWLSTAPHSRAETFYRKAGWQENGTYGKGEIRFEFSRERWIGTSCR
jgi:GNAT superfamily N-acetyltransferase